MNIVILQGSPNRDGSTAILCEEFARGARQAGHAVGPLDALRDLSGTHDVRIELSK